MRLSASTVSSSCCPSSAQRLTRLHRIRPPWAAVRANIRDSSRPGWLPDRQFLLGGMFQHLAFFVYSWLTFSPAALLPRARYPGKLPPICLHLRFESDLANAERPQPDGYLTEERKAQEPDQGFSTFFSETGTIPPPKKYSPSRTTTLTLSTRTKARASTFPAPSTAISSQMSSTRSAPVPTETCSTPR